MFGGVITGTLWGLIVSGVVLAAMSLSTPLPPRPDAIPEVMEDAASEITAPETEVTSSEPEPELQPEATPMAEDEAVGSAEAEVAPAPTPAPAPVETPEIEAEPPVAPELPDAPADSDAAEGVIEESVVDPAPAPQPSISAPPDAPAPGTADATDATDATRMPQINATPEDGIVPVAVPRRLSVPQVSEAPEEVAVDPAPALPPIPVVDETDAVSEEAALPPIPPVTTPPEDAATAPAQEDIAAAVTLPETPSFPQIDPVTPAEDTALAVPEAAPEPESEMNDEAATEAGAADAQVAEAEEETAPEETATPERRLPQIVAADQLGTPPTAPALSQPLTNGATSRFPQIGTAPAPDDDTPAPEAPIVEDISDAPPNALRDHAVAFEAPDGQPLLSVVLIDDPEAGLDLDVLTRFTFPVAFAVDPTAPGAADRAQSYRDAGFEVVIYADIFPDGATPPDAETALAAAVQDIPEAVAVMDTPDSRVQADRPILDATVAAVAETGHGVVAFPRGLNAAEQTARRAEVPVATLFRLLDDEDQSAPVITRFLTRAAFAASADGAVVVAGRTRPDTVTALFSWALGERSEGVTIAPLSAALLRVSE
ncbi:MAG: divergent polysaccharide deacetylase family protein [Pseudomonadota bacterium]